MGRTAQQVDIKPDLQQLESLLGEIENLADPDAAARVARIVQGLLEFHGAGLARILDCLAGAGDAARPAIDAMLGDEVISSLLLLHGMHPLDLPTRVRAALEGVEPYLAAHHGRVELLEVTDEGVVRLRLEGNCHGCPSSRITLQDTIQEAIYAAAPDVTQIDVEGLAEEEPAEPAGDFVPVSQLTAHQRPLYPEGCGIPRP